MNERAFPLPSLKVSAAARALYLLLAATSSFAIFALLPFFNAIGQGPRSPLELVDVPIVSMPQRDAREKISKPETRKRPKPRLAAERKVKALTPRRPDLALAVSLMPPTTTLASGLGDTSVDFRIAEQRVATPKETLIKTFIVRDLDERPRLLVHVNPIYPLQAEQYGTMGYVDVEFEIDTDGTVDTIRAVSADPPGVFEEAACDAVKRWKFTIPLKNGKAVRVLARQRIEFSVEKR